MGLWAQWPEAVPWTEQWGGTRVQDSVEKQVQSPEDWNWLDAGGEEAMSVLGLLLGGEGTGGHASHWARGRDQGTVP